MTIFEAREKAQSILDEQFKNESCNVIIDDRYTVEFSRGWLFAYNIDTYIDDPTSEDFLMVIHPIVVDKIDGTMSRISDCSLKFAEAEEMIDYYLKNKEGISNDDS